MIVGRAGETVPLQASRVSLPLVPSPSPGEERAADAEA
jgi:hypothetical protein